MGTNNDSTGHLRVNGGKSEVGQAPEGGISNLRGGILREHSKRR